MNVPLSILIALVGAVVTLVVYSVPARRRRRRYLRSLIPAANSSGAPALVGLSNLEPPASFQRSILEGPIAEDRGSKNEPMVVCAANESRFVQATYDVPLTAYTVGWKDPNDLAALLEFIAPSVPVSHRFSWHRTNNAGSFLSELDDIRAIGSEFKRIDFTGDEQESRTYNKGLTVRLDKDEMWGPKSAETVASWLKMRLLRNDLRRATVLLSAAGADTPVTWDATAHPDQQMRHACDRAERGVDGVRDGMGLRPNRVLIGGLAWALRREVYEAESTLVSRYQLAEWDEKKLADYLRVEAVKVSNALYQASATGKSVIIGNTVLAYYAQPLGTRDDPSCIKRFVSPTETSGFDLAVHLEEHPKYTDVTVEHYSNNIITSSLGIEKLSVSEG